MIDHERKKFGILAFPAGHSLSPVMFEAAGVPYGVFEIPEEEFSDFMKARDFDGLSVSLPYKERVMEFLDEVSDDARKIGAVNTVMHSDGKLHGFNTDWIGAVEALLSGLGSDESLSGKKVIVLGAGGAARAIVYGLLEEGASVTVLNRDLKEAQGLADDFGIEVGLLNSIEGRECDILIQATSVWLTAGLEVKIVPDKFVRELGSRGGLVMDIVYKPLMTPLLEMAQAAGCRIVTGEKMLLNQACEQFKIWFGKEAPREDMGEALGRGVV
jgi:shikimate dehydrogenase